MFLTQTDNMYEYYEDQQIVHTNVQKIKIKTKTKSAVLL